MASARIKEEATPVPPEDAWAYTPEHLQAVCKSRGRRGYRLGPDDLEKLMRDADASRRNGKEYRVSPAELEKLEAAHGGPPAGVDARVPHG